MKIIIPRYSGGFFCSLCLAVALLPSIAPAYASEEVRLGFLNAARKEMSRADVRTAFNLWSHELAAEFGISLNIQYYDDMARMRQDFLSGKINGVTADAMSLVQNFKLDELAEGYSIAMPGGVNLQLMTGNDSAIRNLDDLAGKSIAVIEGDKVAEIYLESLCLRRYQRECSRVFAKIQRVPNNNQAVMRLFFGKADLALVNRYGFELAREMNPQLNNKIGRVIDELPVTSMYYAFFSTKVDKALRTETLRPIPGMHLYPRGRQLLDLFKMDSMKLAEPVELKPFIKLEKEYRELRERYGSKRGSK